MRKKTKLMLLTVIGVCTVAAMAALLFIWQKSRVSFLCTSTLLETPKKYAILSNAQTTLSVPTQITKIGEDYFLVDCYHDRILTSPSLDRPLAEWHVLTDKISRGHTIAGDGMVYLADDTENNRILVFEKLDGEFYLTQTFDEIGIRPHYVVYDADTRQFYALSSMTGELYVFSRPDKSSAAVVLEKILTVPELDGIYVRSFTLDGNDIYFVSGNRTIMRMQKSDLQIMDSWPVPDEIAGMIQLCKIQNYYYITVSTDLYGNQDYATILRVKSLDDLADSRWEDIYTSFIGGGTPYYISYFDDHYYLTEHRIPGHDVWEFDVVEDRLTNIRTLFP